MTAVLLAVAAAASFGAITVAIRVALSGGGRAARASAATLVTSCAVTFAASLVRHDYTAAWKFFLAGILAPGLSQILFTRSVKDVGASRTSVTVGTAPLFALVPRLGASAGAVLLVTDVFRPERVRIEDAELEAGAVRLGEAALAALSG